MKAVLFDMYETLVTHFNSPLYFGSQIAEDAGIPPESFYKTWHRTEDARTRGELTTDGVIGDIMRENGCYSPEKLAQIMDKRRAVKRDGFLHLDSEILPLLRELKTRGIAIGLISNCFSEEAEVIRECKLFPYFDSVMLSCEQGAAKPDERIFLNCLRELSLPAGECLYVGDGGSSELEAAQGLGMKAVQALWYISRAGDGTSEIKKDFPHAESPLEVLDYLA